MVVAWHSPGHQVATVGNPPQAGRVDATILALLEKSTLEYLLFFTSPLSHTLQNGKPLFPIPTEKRPTMDLTIFPPRQHQTNSSAEPCSSSLHSSLSTTQSGLYFSYVSNFTFLHFPLHLPSCYSLYPFGLTSPTTSQPFLPPTSTIPSFFPPRSYAIKIPLFLLLAGICGVTLFFGRVMLAEARKKRVKGGKKV